MSICSRRSLEKRDSYGSVEVAVKVHLLETAPGLSARCRRWKSKTRALGTRVLKCWKWNIRDCYHYTFDDHVSFPFKVAPPEQGRKYMSYHFKTDGALAAECQVQLMLRTMFKPTDVVEVRFIGEPPP